MRTKIKIFLDDRRVAPKDWILIESFPKFESVVSNPDYEIEEVSFDHDLHPEHYIYGNAAVIPYDTFLYGTGMECAKALVKFCYKNNQKLPKCTVHSWNSVGAQNIANFLNEKALLLFQDLNFFVEIKPYNVMS